MKMKYVDIAVSIIFVVALVVIYFFWKCQLDLYATILAGIILVITGILKFLQYKKLKKLISDKK